MSRNPFLISVIFVSAIHVLALKTDHEKSNQSKKYFFSTPYSKNSVSISIRSETSYKESTARKKSIHKVAKIAKAPTVKPKTVKTNKAVGSIHKFSSYFKVSPSMPYLSRVYEETGVVLVKVVYDLKNGVKSVNLQKSSGHERLDNEAMRALKESKISKSLIKSHQSDKIFEEIIRLEFKLE